MRSFLAVLFAVALASATYSEDALKDEIHNLPGAPSSVPFRMFSGYVPVDKSGSRQIFYWFVESEKSPSTDPVVFWTNGGPGCSGLGGFLTEQGPFRPDKNGTLAVNKYPWNKVANMIFVEQPAGVGFSTISDKDFKYGDAQAAQDNYEFIKGWLAKFPNYNHSRFYIASESYGGHYLPTLAKDIVQGGGVNFKGMVVGNPLTYMPYRNFGQFGTWSYHQLIPKPMFDAYLKAGCDKKDGSTECNTIENEMGELTQGLDPYGLDFPICADDGAAAGRANRYQFLKKVQEANGRPLGGYFPDVYKPCEGDFAAAYLNRADVQKAIHAIAPAGGWADCSDAVGNAYNQTDVNLPMMPYYKFLIDSGKDLDIVIYSGDDDSVCATLGSQQFIWDMGYAIEKPWAPWLINKQTVGYHVKFKGFSFVTMHGAGHMVPATRPAEALEMFTRYLAGQW